MSKAENPKAVAGDNSGVAGDQVRAFLERVERLDEEMAGLREDRKEVLAEAKGQGFDTGTMRQLLKLRKMDHAERQEKRALLELYGAAIGMGDLFL